MKRLLPLLFVMVAIFYCGESEGREWVSFESDDVYQYAYNEDSIAQNRQGHGRSVGKVGREGSRNETKNY